MTCYSDSKIKLEAEFYRCFCSLKLGVRTLKVQLGPIWSSYLHDIYFAGLFNAGLYKDNKIILENYQNQTLELKLMVSFSIDIDNKL